MDSFSTGFWTVGLTVGVVFVLWLWARTKRHAGPESMGGKIKGKIRSWLGAVGQDDFVKGEERIERLEQEMTTRLTNVERGLTHQDRIEDLAVDLRRRLHLVEQSSSKEPSEAHATQQAIPRSVLRLGLRMTLTDLIWKELGIVQPWDLSDQQLHQVFQGPFCRNCLRSLIVSKPVDGERVVRHQCRHCLLSWRVDPTTPTIPLGRLKRELYEMLDAEYRKTGAIGLRE
ncbi:MAG: hypothetical protein R3351_01240 [Nitrospirales bacterium]|nr:hypothetical protein [Nitrospirales bacterium]